VLGRPLLVHQPQQRADERKGQHEMGSLAFAKPDFVVGGFVVAVGSG